MGVGIIRNENKESGVLDRLMVIGRLHERNGEEQQQSPYLYESLLSVRRGKHGSMLCASRLCFRKKSRYPSRPFDTKEERICYADCCVSRPQK